jgi:predicted chitinase
MIIRKGMRGDIVKAWQEFLAANGYEEAIGIVSGEFDLNTEKATIQYQVDNALEIDGIAGPETLSAAKRQGFDTPTQKSITEINLEQFSYIMKETKYGILEEHLPYCNETLQKFEINNKLRIQHFLAQIGHESMGLKYMSEIASGQAYEGRQDLGNYYPGDGKRFKGHGPIQITGRANHAGYFNYIERPELIKTPEILETDLALCWGASGWFWKTRGLNEVADSDDDTISIFRLQNKALCKITKIINGGYRGLTERAWYLDRAKKIICC